MVKTVRPLQGPWSSIPGLETKILCGTAKNKMKFGIYYFLYSFSLLPPESYFKSSIIGMTESLHLDFSPASLLVAQTVRNLPAM